MDSESLKKKLPMPRMSSIGRHTNLTSSDKLASVTKSQKVRFVAHEPVRAAVKPLTVDAVKPGGRHMVGDPHTVQHSNPSCSVNMVAPIVSRTCDSVCGTSTVVSMNGGAMPRSAVEGELYAGSGGHQMPSQGVREVEGQSDSPTDLVKLQEEKTKLEEQLHFQNTVGGHTRMHACTHACTHSHAHIGFGIKDFFVAHAVVTLGKNNTSVLSSH